MADNPPSTPPPSPTPAPNPAPRTTPPLKGTGLTGSLKNPTQRLPIRVAGAGKIVVMLSSVAKPPPAGTQALPRVAPPVPPATPAPAPAVIPPAATAPAATPPLPPKQIKPAPELPTPSRPQLSTTTYVKLPPKTTAPGWSLSGKTAVTPLPAPIPTAAPAPVAPPAAPPKVAELTTKKPGAQNIPPIKLNEPVDAPTSPAEESIFLQKSAPAPAAEPSPAIPKTPMPITTTAPMTKPQAPFEAKAPVEAKPAPVTPTAAPAAKAPVETKAPVGDPVSLDLFQKSQTPDAKPADTKSAPTPAPEAKDKPAPLKAPALMPPNLATPPPVTGGGLRPVRPPPLPPTLTKPLGSALGSALTLPAVEAKPEKSSVPIAPSAKLEKPPEPVAVPIKIEKAPEPIAEKPAPAPAKEAPITSTLLAAEMAILAPKLDKPSAPVADKLPPPLAAKPAETPTATPPALPKIEKAPEPVAEKLPPPLATKPVETPVATPPALPKVEKAPEPIAEKLPPPLAAKPAETPVATPPALPKVEKAPEPVAEKLPPPLAKPAEPPVIPAPALNIAPPMLEKKPEPVAEKLPPPVTKPTEAPVINSPVLHVAPPMLEKAPEPTAEKLPQPHLSPHAPIAEARKSDPPGTPEPLSKPVHKAPAMLPSETAQKPSEPPKKRRSITSWLKKSAPIVVSSTSTKTPEPAPVAEAKPALKPPTMPSRSLLVPAPIDEGKPAPDTKTSGKLPEKSAVVTSPIVPAEKATSSSALKPALEAAAPTAIAAALASDKKKSKEKSKADASSKSGAPPDLKKTDLPPTRAERAKTRRLYGLIFFWVLLFPATIAILFYASMQVGRDTRLEGQVIPPPGTVLSNEVWIVTDFRPLASGITEDLAAERTPLMQEIQERQDHVQRAQADVASREERIRLIQEEVAAHKSEIESVVKQARDATQKVWDVDGADVDNDYASRMNSLKRTIADRAKSLNLKYTPDDTYDSPEVWANAYRLALYEVPAGVDGVKEHAWLSDQMKQWRDYQKSADDKKEALREKAAQIKLGPAPKITDLNAKIDDLQQRIDATEAEEVPLKAELQQAQADLVTAQSADVGLDDKYYKQLYSLPGESVIKRIELKPNGRFTWLDDNVFLQGENQHSYYIFARATRADGRQFWSLGRLTVEKNHVFPVVFEPSQFVSTKAILRPTLSPEEIEQ